MHLLRVVLQQLVDFFLIVLFLLAHPAVVLSTTEDGNAERKVFYRDLNRRSSVIWDIGIITGWTTGVQLCTWNKSNDFCTLPGHLGIRTPPSS